MRKEEASSVGSGEEIDDTVAVEEISSPCNSLGMALRRWLSPPLPLTGASRGYSSRNNANVEAEDGV